MDSLPPARGLTALYAKLRNTWLLHQYRRVKRQILRRSEGEAFLLRRYARIHGKPLNLTNPQTYTEKLFWRMITWNRGDMPARFTRLVDKYTVRTHVADLVGEQHLTKLLWHGNDPHAIPFEQLPDEYVIKPTHAAGHVILVQGQPNRAEIIRTAASWLASNYYWQGREFQYYGISPQLVIEECLRDENGALPPRLQNPLFQRRARTYFGAQCDT